MTETARGLMVATCLFAAFGSGRYARADVAFRDDRFVVKLTAAEAQAAMALPIDSLPVGLSRLDDFCRAHGIERGHRLLSTGGSRDPNAFKRIGLDRIYVLELPYRDASAVKRLIAVLRKLEWVEYAEPMYVPELASTFPDDPRFNEQWAHHNTGQTGGAPDNDMDSPEAWDIATGDPSVLVAVIDTGVDADHPDLVDNLVPGVDLTNSAEGIEDVFVHGTPVTGIIAARGNNGVGIAGVCWTCSVMPLKVFGSTGWAPIEEAIVFAADSGADVVNMSLTGGGGDAWSDAIDYGLELGMLTVAGAGNTGTYFGPHPAAFPQVVSAGGIQSNNSRYGSYGEHQDVVAPTTVLSTRPGGIYASFRGTSAAAPHVAGLAGLLRSADPTLHVQELRQLLRLGAQDLVGIPAEDTPGWDPYLGYGRINSHNSLSLIDGPWLAFDQPHHVCADSLSIDLKDTVAGGSVDVTLTGSSGGDEEIVTVTPVTANGYYHGPIPIAWVGHPGAVVIHNGRLDVTDTETITASQGSLSATSFMDCSKRFCLDALDYSNPTTNPGDCDRDGFLDWGETWNVEATFDLFQTEEMFDIEARLTSGSPYVELLTDEWSWDSVIANEVVTPSFRMPAGAPATGSASFSFDVPGGRGWENDEEGCADAGYLPFTFVLPVNRDGAGAESWTALPPEDLAGSTAFCPASFRITWDAIPGAARYDVFRSAVSCVDAIGQTTPYGSTTTTTFNDNAPNPQAFSYYAVEAIEPGTKCPTERACIHAGCVCSPPGDPTNLRLERLGQDVRLSWDDPQTLSFTWNVYRAGQPDPSLWGPPLYANVADADTTRPGIQFVDAGAAAAGSSFFYLITADNGCAESPLF